MSGLPLVLSTLLLERPLTKLGAHRLLDCLAGEPKPPPVSPLLLQSQATVPTSQVSTGD